MLTPEQKENLVDQLLREVVNQFKEDFESGDTTAIFELLYEIPVELLISYLPEQKQDIYGKL